jgi:hypothetical protein
VIRRVATRQVGGERASLRFLRGKLLLFSVERLELLGEVFALRLNRAKFRDGSSLLVLKLVKQSTGQSQIKETRGLKPRTWWISRLSSSLLG